MNYFVVALVSIVLLLINLAIGWALANRSVRAQVGPAIRRVLSFRRRTDQ